MPTVVEDSLRRRDSSRSGISLSEERAERRSPSLIGVTVGSLEVTCSRLGISLRRSVVFNNGMGLLRRGGPHNGTSTYTASRRGGVPPISGQPQQNSQSGPSEQPQATTPHEERARTDEMGLANLALRIKYRGERTRMIPHGSQGFRRHTHRTTLEGIPPASRDDSARACRRRPRNARANQPL